MVSTDQLLSSFPTSSLVFLTSVSLVGQQSVFSTNPNHSRHRYPLLSNRILALQLPTYSSRLHHVGNVALPRSRRRRIPRRPRLLHLPHLRRLSRLDCIRKWIVDVRRWLHGHTQGPQPVLEIRLPLHRLSGVRIPGNDGQ